MIGAGVGLGVVGLGVVGLGVVGLGVGGGIGGTAGHRSPLSLQ